MVPFADPVGLTENPDGSWGADPTGTGYPPTGDGQGFLGDDIARRQLAEPLPAAVLGRRPTSQARMDMVRIDGFLQHGQFAAQVARPYEVALEQPRLEVG